MRAVGALGPARADSEVARALLRGKHGVEDDDRSVSPTDVTADVYA